MDYLSFYLSVGWHLRRLARADDVVVAMTDPPLLSVLVYWALTGRSVRVVNWLQDLYPEVATALGVGALGGRLGAWLRQVRNRSLRHATLNVAIGERMAKAVRATGIPSGQVRALHNWADCEAIRPLAPAANRLRREWGVEDAFVVGYSGNLGRAHAYATVLDAAALLLAESIGVAATAGDGIAAAGRPIVFVGDPDGEIPRLLATYDCGRAVAEGDAAGFAAAVRQLRDDADARERQGSNARRMLEDRFGQQQALAAWEALLGEVALSR